MRFRGLLRWLTVGAMLAMPALAHAQEAAIIGTVADATGGALPGVTIQAVHEATGNSFESVTDERGDYRIPGRVGAYTVTADLPGFTAASRPVTVLVGQEAVVDLTLTVGGVQETVTVTGEAPLLDVTQSSMGGNIDARQLQELPVQGRNWVDLVMLAPGARVNSVTSNPSQEGAANNRAGGDYQLNVDGQAVTNYFVALDSTTKRQPRFSRDAMAEFEFKSSRFDATQGRSMGLQVNAVTKSGTNTPSGTFSGYFRHDRFNADDLIAKRRLPYENQQIVGTFGGPVRRDKVHLFGYYEYERQPATLLFNTPYPAFNVDLSTDDVEKKGGGRLDVQFTPQTRLSARVGQVKGKVKGGGGANTMAGSVSGSDLENQEFLGTLTQVLSNSVVNELKGGYSQVGWEQVVLLENSNPASVSNQLGLGKHGPSVIFRGFNAGAGSAYGKYPDHQWQEVTSVRDDLTLSLNKGGRHTMKLGGEVLYAEGHDESCVRCSGVLFVQGGPIPANIESLFPDPLDSGTWILDPLSPLVSGPGWRQAIIDKAQSNVIRYTFAGWIQDDWAVKDALTLNLGLRYDYEDNSFANDVFFPQYLLGEGPGPNQQHNDANNVGPRVGFSYSGIDQTVVRGGYGVYFGFAPNAHYSKFYEQAVNIDTPNDGRPDFASNPYNGPRPTLAQLQANLCTSASVPGCVRHVLPTGGVSYGPGVKMPYSHQASIGFQRQVNPVAAVEIDYVFTGTRDPFRDMPLNVTYNPETGVNYPFSDISRRAFPDWGYISGTINGARANYHALQTAFTKRFSDSWQASFTYTLAGSWDQLPDPVQLNPATSTFEKVSFATAPDLGGEYTLAIGDQRHRAVFNGIWEAPGGFQLSGLYFFSSGTRWNTQWGGDLRKLGGIRPNDQRLRPDGTIVERNNFVGSALHRVDMRIQRRISLGGRVGIDAIVEVFNAFNHLNIGNYAHTSRSRTGGERNSNFLTPTQNRNIAYNPRTMQFGFRLAF